MKDRIKIGDRIRTFDAPYWNCKTKGPSAGFTEGKVVDIVMRGRSEAYEIVVDRQIVGGDEFTKYYGTLRYVAVEGEFLAERLRA